jgi:hypothetical protein
LHALLGISRFPIDDTVRNLFKRFGQGRCQRFSSGLWNWQFKGSDSKDDEKNRQLETWETRNPKRSETESFGSVTRSPSENSFPVLLNSLETK